MYKVSVNKQQQHNFISNMIDHAGFGIGYTAECSCGWACTYVDDDDGGSGEILLDCWEIEYSDKPYKYWLLKHKNKV